jgi:hypothetical protein
MIEMLATRWQLLILLLQAVLGEWDLEEMRDPTYFQGVTAEFAACVGSGLIKEIVIDRKDSGHCPPTLLKAVSALYC